MKNQTMEMWTLNSNNIRGALCSKCARPKSGSECRFCYMVPTKGVKTKGVKHDQEKNRLDLLSPVWLNGVGQVLTYGAKKYAAHNWRKGIERSRLIGASLRHILAYLGGEDCDPETGLLHLYHASCCLMFASELHHTKPETDDRYGKAKE